MNPAITAKLESLGRQYATLRGQPFRHFFCPINLRDEDVELCSGHIENRAFQSAGAAWTVQRKDVDNFFGFAFEGDFTVLDERGRHQLFDVLANRKVSQKLRPTVRVDGREVQYYLPDGAVPSHHTEITLEREGHAPIRIAFKLQPSEIIRAADASWDVGYEKDLRIPALVFGLKAAHLTLFEMLGYEYALSAGGHFLGYDVLGRFFSGKCRTPEGGHHPCRASPFR